MQNFVDSAVFAADGPTNSSFELAAVTGCTVTPAAGNLGDFFDVANNRIDSCTEKLSRRPGGSTPQFLRENPTLPCFLGRALLSWPIGVCCASKPTRAKLSKYPACCGAQDTREIVARLSCNAAISRKPDRPPTHTDTC